MLSGWLWIMLSAKSNGVSQPLEAWKIHDYLREEKELTEVSKGDQNRELRGAIQVYIKFVYSPLISTY